MNSQRLLIATLFTSVLGLSLLVADEGDHPRGLNHVYLTGKSGCSLCEGVGDQHDVMLTTPGGIRFVLKGEGEQYDAVHKIRKEGKTITVRLVGQMEEKTGSDKQPYLQCQVKDIYEGPRKTTKQ